MQAVLGCGGIRHGTRQRDRAPRRARARNRRLVPRDVQPLAAFPAVAEGELQRRRRRAHRSPAARPRRHAPLLHDRGGAGGARRLRSAPATRLLEIPQAPLNLHDPAAADESEQARITGRLRLPGSTPPVRLWFMAARPRTLPAAVAPVLVGTAAAVEASGDIRVGAFIAALIG